MHSLIICDRGDKILAILKDFLLNFKSHISMSILDNMKLYWEHARGHVLIVH